MTSNDHLTRRADAVFDTDLFWKTHDADIITAPNHKGSPFFYPIYHYKNAYSYSPFLLLQDKGHFTLNPDAVRDLALPGNDTSYPDAFIDADITRVGGPPTLSTGFKDPAAYIAAMAKAMQEDITEIETLNPGHTHYVLCGGRDSLNLLLANWNSKVVALSAQPNFPLVQDFVKRNNLPHEVRELKDLPPEDSLDREIVELCTMTNLENWKWATHLVQIAQDADHKAVFWKGQFADAILTDYWRSYTYRRSRSAKIIKKIWRRVARHLPGTLSYLPDQLFLEDYRQAIWKRGAMAQGAHMGFLRSLTRCLWVSGYHGPRTSAVWLDGDLRNTAKRDLRPEIGALLFGGPVWYPTENPAPPASSFRTNLRSVARFETALEKFGITTSSPS